MRAAKIEQLLKGLRVKLKMANMKLRKNANDAEVLTPFAALPRRCSQRC